MRFYLRKHNICIQIENFNIYLSTMASISMPEENFEGGDFNFDDDADDDQFVATNSGRKRLFSKELRCMMFGFGDDKNPYTETVDLLEDLVIEYIAETTHRAMEIGRTGRVQVEDIIFLVRKDPRKYARVKDLLTMNEELKKARKAFDEIKYVGTEGKLK
ncbi:transcription initiation factor TFIID subunit 13 [Drosophila santomea]|uniref:transcription initiation factor TFIID subunit 13 n=1 Tax=Drosophila santomea TaxID=129105 RepID=UPI0019538BC9|nr:transcription initiation factor TFIID subunit 13 [Drosophila santomea]